MEKIEEFLDSMPVPLMAVYADLSISNANGLALTDTPMGKDELPGLTIGRALHCLHHRDHPEGCGHGPNCNSCGIREIVLNTFGNGKKYHRGEVSLSRGNNENVLEQTFLVSSTLLSRDKKEVLNEDPEKLCILTLEDISEQKKYERLHERRTKYVEAIIEASPDAIVTIDSNGRIHG